MDSHHFANDNTYIGPGIWTGLQLFFVGSGFGILLERRKTRGCELVNVCVGVCVFEKRNNGSTG